jgi:hypothetical protein
MTWEQFCVKSLQANHPADDFKKCRLFQNALLVAALPCPATSFWRDAPEILLIFAQESAIMQP